MKIKIQPIDIQNALARQAIVGRGLPDVGICDYCPLHFALKRITGKDFLVGLDYITPPSRYDNVEFAFTPKLPFLLQIPGFQGDRWKRAFDVIVNNPDAYEFDLPLFNP